MKKIFLLSLALIAIGGIFVACKNKNEDTPENFAEKWVIKKVNANTETGNLYVTLPKDTKWDLTIYNAGSDKVLSNTMLQTNFPLQPGLYDLEINHIWIKGVPVEKGNDTRLKTGILRIRDKTPWTLYDEAKQKVLVNGSSSETRGVPIGKYKLTIKDQDHAIEIKDGKTVKM